MAMQTCSACGKGAFILVQYSIGAGAICADCDARMRLKQAVNPVVKQCSYCGGPTVAPVAGYPVVVCPDCDAQQQQMFSSIVTGRTATGTMAMRFHAAAKFFTGGDARIHHVAIKRQDTMDIYHLGEYMPYAWEQLSDGRWKFRVTHEWLCEQSDFCRILDILREIDGVLEKQEFFDMNVCEFTITQSGLIQLARRYKPIIN